MGALLALQFRLMWRGTSTFLRMFVGFFIVSVVMALAKDKADRDAVSGLIAGPLGFLAIGISAAISSCESMAWFTPIPRSARTWARLAILALTGIPVTAMILALATSVRLSVPAAQLAANIWLCWIGGGLLLLFLDDLIQARHPATQILCLALGVAPGIAMTCYHIAERCPWEVILAEQGVIAVLVALTRIVNVDTEQTRLSVFPKTWRPGEAKPEAPEAAASPSTSRKLERVPSIAPILLRGLSDSRAIVTLFIFWILTSAVPLVTPYAMFGLVILPISFQAALNCWRPFQSVPLSRSKVFVLITAPILVAWALIVVVHGLSSWAFAPTELVRTEPDGLHWTLPAAKRSPNADLSGKFRRGPLPRDPERLAVLMSEAYRAAYGLEISPAQILAVPVPADIVDNDAWLQRVQKHFEGAVSRRILEWRLLMGLALLAMGLLSLIGPLPGRFPSWIRWIILSGGILVPMVVLVLLSLETNLISSYLPALLRPAYLAVYDRPRTLAAVFAVISVALYLRHIRVFRTSEIVDPVARA